MRTTPFSPSPLWRQVHLRFAGAAIGLALWACGGGSKAAAPVPPPPPPPPSGPITDAMPRISAGVPAYASSTAASSNPSNANGNNPAVGWASASLPATLTYDLSSAPAASRQMVLVAWYAIHAVDWLPSTTTGAVFPTAYTIDLNSAAGGGAPPTTGWTTVVTVTGNARSSRQHLINLAGANWLRMSVSAGTDATVEIDLDVHTTTGTATDDWLFMGDSITFISTPRPFSDLPALVHTAWPGHYPAVIDAAIGGSSTVNAMTTIDANLALFPGRYVTLNYGTNDDPNNYQMEALVQKVIAAGKIPVVPHMPWSSNPGPQAHGPVINAAIDALYAKYPSILRGPDLWTFFTNRTDLLSDGTHPNATGQEELRKQWAAVMESTYR